MLTLVRTLAERRGDAGMATAEYAMGTCAAAGLGGVLYKLLTGDFATDLVKGLIGRALDFVL